MSKIERDLWGSGLRGYLRRAAFRRAVSRVFTCAYCGRVDCPRRVVFGHS
jgi:hypothetical protein